jgi:flagellar basal-body rod modification protein FlgD
MTTINQNAISNELLATVNGAKKADRSGAAASQDKFMTLLVTQMKNQDPLNPLDNAQVTSQLAQLSTVTGIDKLNSTLEALMGSYKSSQNMEATSMIGHEVLVPGTSLQLANGKAQFGFELTQPADKVSVKILGPAGEELQTIDFGAQQAGTHAFEWNGLTDKGVASKDGAYSFKVLATRGSDKVDASALSFGKVTSVSTGAQGARLNIPGMNAVNVADVRQIL